MNATPIVPLVAPWFSLGFPEAGTVVRRRPTAKPATGVT